MYAEVLKLTITCHIAQYSLLDIAVILLSLKDSSNNIEKYLSKDLKKEYLVIRKNIKSLTKPKKVKLYKQIEALFDYYINLEAYKNTEQPTYENDITRKISSLASMVSNCSYGGGLLLLSPITTNNNNFKDFMDYLNNQIKNTKRKKDIQTLSKLISLLTDIREAFQKDNTIASLIIDTAKTVTDIWTIKTQYNQQ